MPTGDAPVCDPRKFYECILGSKRNYVKDNETGKCNCPRQCRRLIYDATISQAKLGESAVSFMKSAYNLTGTLKEITNDYCIVEVCKSTRQSNHNLVMSTTIYRVRNYVLQTND